MSSYIEKACKNHKLFKMWKIRSVRSSTRLVIIILYPASPSRIIVLLKAPGSTALPCWFYSVQNDFCQPFFLRDAKIFSARSVDDAFFDHIRQNRYMNCSLCSASQRKCWKFDIRSLAFNNTCYRPYTMTLLYNHCSTKAVWVHWTERSFFPSCVAWSGVVWCGIFQSHSLLPLVLFKEC